MDTRDALNGALVADAAAMGLHWMYDQEHLKRVAGSGDVLFRQPDAAIFDGQKSYFAHPSKRTGDASHYGESARVAATVALAEDGYRRDQHVAQYMGTFGPCGSYCGFADRPTKALVAAVLAAGDALPETLAADDTQMPPLAVVPALFVADADAEALAQAVSLFTQNPVGLNGASTVLACLRALADGASLGDALRSSAQTVATGELQEKLIEALAFADGSYDPLAAALHFGLPCHMVQGLPVVWHTLLHSSDYESVVRDNILSGGDCCGRAMALGAIAGFVYGVPQTMRQRVTGQLF